MWNVLLGSLAKVASSGKDKSDVLDLNNCVAAKIFGDRFKMTKASQRTIYALMDGETVTNAATTIMYLMSRSIVVEKLGDNDVPRPNAQTYCIVASVLQYNRNVDSTIALEMFQNATTLGITADGRFVNALFRCYGDDIDIALYDWKNVIRPQCLSDWPSDQMKREHLLACYDGLLYICGRAYRPDIALRLVYAMKKEKIETTEQSLNSYKAGKRLRKLDESTSTSISAAAQIVQRLKFATVYESLLEVECSKYNTNDRRRQGEPRVRIIV